MNRTPFYDRHIALNGKMVDFFGWELPVQYSTITLEHTAVRQKAGLFDISHMGQVYVWGKDAEATLQHLVTSDVRKATIGKGIYAHFLNDRGGVIDDLFVFRLEADKFFLIVNASRVQPDLEWMKAQKKSFNITILEAPQAAAFALQGPEAERIMEKVSPQAARLGHHAIGDFSFGDVTALVSRTGYTGEDGFELYGPAGHLLSIWDQLLAAGRPLGLLPCGLGARDTLRTEASYPLYGHELDDKHTPLESGLGWVVSWDKGHFIGREALVKQKSDGIKVKLAGFQVDGGGVVRPGGKIVANGKEVGTVASGTFSPTLGKAIGMAFLPMECANNGFQLKIQLGSREMSAMTVKLPFYKRPVASIK